MALKMCQGRCGKEWEDHGKVPPTMPDDSVALFLCFGCALSLTLYSKERGIEPPNRLPDQVSLNKFLSRIEAERRDA